MDGAAIAGICLAGASIVCNIFIALAVMSSNQRARAREIADVQRQREFDQQKQKSETLESELKRSMAEATDGKLAIFRAEQNAQTQMLTLQLVQAQQRLQDGEVSFRVLREADSKLKLEFIERLSEIKQLFGTAATKEDLKELEERIDNRNDK